MWLHSLPRIRCTTATMDNAAAGGYLKVVQWLHENRTKGCIVKALNRAATNGHIGVVQWLLANHSKHSNPAIFSAMEDLLILGLLTHSFAAEESGLYFHYGIDAILIAQA
ncbi:hypothetical protein PHMEG_00024482 [Phytophthora megakarya]|uniref:Ankyrin repeat-containing domain n=1 Tax=Phytophthora megakarya TaxID=4795 RepID=A0A225VEB8_9STRA|nr:hypothetical protein PHMEG_00024482 [Phytophthora megakarya]